MIICKTFCCFILSCAYRFYRNNAFFIFRVTSFSSKITHFYSDFKNFHRVIFWVSLFYMGTRGGADGCDTAFQALGSRVRFRMVS